MLAVKQFDVKIKFHKNYLIPAIRDQEKGYLCSSVIICVHLWLI